MLIGLSPTFAAAGGVALAPGWGEGVRGVNYIPSYAASPYETWNDYDPETVARELGWAANLGFNAVRVTLSQDALRDRPTSALENLQDFVAQAEALGMRVMPVLFDGWGVDAASYMGRDTETLREAYDRMTSHPAAYRMDSDFAARIAPTALELQPHRRVPKSRDRSVLFWGHWRPSPPRDALGRDLWPIFAHFVRQVTGSLREEPAILAWDIMNDPAGGLTFRSATGGEADLIAVHEFVLRTLDEIRDTGATQPVTVSVGGGYGSAGPFMNELDVLSVLAYGGVADASRAVMELKGIAQGRPVLLTHAGSALLPRTREEAGEDEQLRLIRQALNAAFQQRAGFFLWHLIEGEAITPWSGLLRRDGTRKPAAEHVRRELRAALPAGT